MPTLPVRILTTFAVQGHFNSVTKEPEKCRYINGTPNFSQADYLLCKVDYFHIGNEVLR